MRPLMPPVQTPDNLFHDGNPLTGELGTIVDAEHLNNVQGTVRDAQSELITVLNAAGINVDPSKQNQLLTALKALLLSRSNPFGDIKSDGTVKTALENLGLGDGTGRLIKTTVINSSQEFVKHPAMKFCRVRIVGGGGGAGGVPATTASTSSVSGGAGGGAYAEVILSAASVPASVTVTIGAGGLPSATNGADGSASTFGSIITCPGGLKSNTGVLISTASALSIGAGSSSKPTVTTGAILVWSYGSGGGCGISTQLGIVGGAGGNSIIGTGGPSKFSGSGSQAGGGPGAGGGGIAIGGSSAAANGGAGANGLCIIEEYA